jgi:Phosphodiester glycosidase
MHALILFGWLGCTVKTGPEPAASWAFAATGLETAEQLLPSGARLLALRFDQSRYQLKLLSPAGGVRVPQDAPKDALAIWNGGYFEPDLRPSGLVVDQGREVSPPSRGSALLLLGDRFSLVRFREAPPAGLRESALQLWPFLIEPGGADGIRRNDGKRARRSAIGLDDSGRGLLVGVVGEGISLFELMALCRQLGAVVAANLDGGPSTGFALTPEPAWSVPSETPIADALVLSAR